MQTLNVYLKNISIFRDALIRKIGCIDMCKLQQNNSILQSYKYRKQFRIALIRLRWRAALVSIGNFTSLQKTGNLWIDHCD